METNKLKEAFESSGLKMRELSRKSGVDIGTVSRLLNGKMKYPSHTTIEKISKALKIK